MGRRVTHLVSLDSLAKHNFCSECGQPLVCGADYEGIRDPEVTITFYAVCPDNHVKYDYSVTVRNEEKNETDHPVNAAPA